MPEQIVLSRRLTITLGLHQVLSWATTFYVPGVILEKVARDLGASPAALLTGFSGALLIAGACAPAVGSWIDRAGGRRPMACGALLLALGLGLLAAANGLALWWLGWSVLGVGMALSLYDAAFAAAGVALGPGAAPVITGIALIGGFASTIGWPLSAALIPHIGWRGLLLAYAVLNLAGTLPLILSAVPGIASGHARCLPAVVESQRQDRLQLTCLSSYFALRWFITSAIAIHILPLMSALGLVPSQAMIAAMLIGPAQVAGRLLDWFASRCLNPLSRARIGALIFPIGTLFLLSGRSEAVFVFVMLYGMSNGVLTVNRGTLPMLVLGPEGYGGTIGRIAFPVMFMQALAPTITAPFVSGATGPGLLLFAGVVAGASACLLIPLRPRLEYKKGLRLK